MLFLALLFAWTFALNPAVSTIGITATGSLTNVRATHASLRQALVTSRSSLSSSQLASALDTYQAAQLNVFLSLNEATLGTTAAEFESVYRDLVNVLLVKHNIFSFEELDALTTPVSVLMLHGQLACLGERTAAAMRSFSLALGLHATPNLLRLLSRLQLGRGDFPLALASAAHAERLIMAAPREDIRVRAAALLLQLQALLQMEASSREGGAAVATVRDPDDDDEEEEESPAAASRRVWRTLRNDLLQRLDLLGMRPPKGDPLLSSAPPRWLGGSAPPNAEEEASWMRAATSTAAEQWATEGYTVLRGLVPDFFFAALRARHMALFVTPDRKALLSHEAPPEVHTDEYQSRRLVWDDELSKYVATRLIPAISRAAGLPVVSVYEFSIEYRRGGDLKPHVDRVQNQMSVSLHLGEIPEDAPLWPLYVAPVGANESMGRPILLRPNDALLYSGPDHTHFRHPLTQEKSLQVIFGYRGISRDNCNV